MNKSDLVSAIADSSGLSKADAARALDAATGAIFRRACKRWVCCHYRLWVVS